MSESEGGMGEWGVTERERERERDKKREGKSARPISRGKSPPVRTA